MTPRIKKITDMATSAKLTPSGMLDPRPFQVVMAIEWISKSGKTPYLNVLGDTVMSNHTVVKPNPETGMVPICVSHRLIKSIIVEGDLIAVQHNTNQGIETLTFPVSSVSTVFARETRDSVIINPDLSSQITK